MTEVGLSHADLQLQEMVRRYARQALAPRAAEMDYGGFFPTEAQVEMAELGLFGLAIPEQFGGLSATRVQSSIVLEELARTDASVALVLMAHMHGTGLIARFGSDSQRRRWLPHAATGRWVAAVGLTEPDTGTDITSLHARADRDGDDY